MSLHLNKEKSSTGSVQDLDIALDRDMFFRTLIRGLAGTLEDVVGVRHASGYFSIVGQTVGEHINDEYRKALGTPQLSLPQVADTLVDLKRRIHGDFYVMEQSEEKIVMGNRECPFGNAVVGRESMCMMTSNVFGSITADNLGYARVELQETIARGAQGCRVVVHLKPSQEAETAPSREYFRAE